MIGILLAAFSCALCVSFLFSSMGKTKFITDIKEVYTLGMKAAKDKLKED